MSSAVERKNMNSLKSRILCVEDDLDSCELLAFILSSTDADYDVTGVHHAAQAKALITTKQFDLYVLDISLPDTDGLELCRWIRRRDATRILQFCSSPQMLRTQTVERRWTLEEMRS